jgi:hypothetical protein
VTRPAPILVTGSHRSGSTWAGRTLASATDIGYINEPCHLRHRPGICRARFRYWFPYICRDNEQPYLEAFRDTLSFRYSLRAELEALRTPKDVARLGRDWGNYAWHRWRDARPLVKDPIAVFSAPWLHERFGAEVVVLIRHPAAFAWSLKRLDWTFPFDHLLHQPLLMRNLLAPFAEEIDRYARRPPDIVEQAILLWRVIHHVIAGYKARYPGWLFVRLEDLASDPDARFRELCERFSIPYEGSVSRAVVDSTRSSNPIEVEKGTSGRSSIRRHSRASIQAWKSRFPSTEVTRIRNGVESVSRLFYGDDDW